MINVSDLLGESSLEFIRTLKQILVLLSCPKAISDFADAFDPPIQLNNDSCALS